MQALSASSLPRHVERRGESARVACVGASRRVRCVRFRVWILCTPPSNRFKTKRDLVETTISGSNHALRFEPGTVVRTTVFWDVPRQWFEPEKSGPDQKFPVRTTLLWSRPDKVVQTRKNWYFQTAQKTSPTWFRPLFLVQTGKTWPIPIFFRLPRLGACVYRYGPVTKSKLSYAVLGTQGIYFTVCTRTRVAYTDAQVAG